MKRYLVIAAVLALGLLICSGISLAQEEAEEDLGYSWGIVSSISSDRIVVIEYDYDTREDINVTYTLGPKVDLKNVESLKDIKEGDSIEIDYMISGNKKVAESITVEKPSKEEYAPSQTDEEEEEAEFE
ncbi:MAG: hypothetical protein ISS24_02730 [Candidatus Omnitrophica bacterium]|nr:hypothetical protein [Candidatus Omnitrophota bacterium]